MMTMNNRGKKDRQGSILIGVLLMMFMVAAISISILARTAYDSKMIIVAKDSHTAYQNSDAKAETIIKNLKKLDNGDFSGKIPENTQINNGNLGCVSGGTNAFCYDKSEDLIGNTEKLVDSGNPNLYYVKQSGSSRDTSRAVLVPMPNRVGNYLTAKSATIDEDLPKITAGACQATITYQCAQSDSTADLEFRISSVDGSELDTGDWRKLGSDPDFDCSGTANADKTVTIIGNTNFSFNNGMKYYFAIKRKSPSPLTLDSGYILVKGSYTASGC